MRFIDVTSTGYAGFGNSVVRAVGLFSEPGAAAASLEHRPMNERAPKAGPAAVKPSETKASSRPSSAPFLIRVVCEGAR